MSQESIVKELAIIDGGDCTTTDGDGYLLGDENVVQYGSFAPHVKDVATVENEERSIIEPAGETSQREGGSEVPDAAGPEITSKSEADTNPKPPSAPTPSPASVADPLYIEMKAESAKLAQKAQAVVNGRFRQAGRCAGYIQAFGGDETLIRVDLEARGVNWPDANCLNPVETVLTREYIFEGEDWASVKNRVSEFARVIKHLWLAKIFTPDGALKYIKGNQGLRGLYAKLDADGYLRILDIKEEKEEVNGTDTIQTDAQKTETVEQAAEQPNGWDTTQTGTVACAVTKKIEQVVADATVVVADATGTLDLSSDAAQAESAFKQVEAEALEAEKVLKAAQIAAEAAAEKAEDELAGQIEEAQRVAMEKAAEVGRAQRLLDLAQRVKKVPVWGDGRFTGKARPASTVGDEWAHGGFSCVLIHTDEDGVFHIIGNVTPPWQHFIGLIDAQFPAT